MKLIQPLIVALLTLLFTVCTAPPDQTLLPTVTPDSSIATPTSASPTETTLPTTASATAFIPTSTLAPIETPLPTQTPTEASAPTTTAIPLETPTQASVSDNATIIYNNTRYRTCPDQGCPAYGHLHRGHLVEVRDRVSEWCQIFNERWPTRKDTFVFCKLLKLGG